MNDDLPEIEGSFTWPQGRRAAVSLSFDDARLSQVDTGLDILDEHGAKATFYVSIKMVDKRLDGWKRAVAGGHEIGNHTMNHPCSTSFAPGECLEDYTLQRMDEELTGANAAIAERLDVTPVTFAYPCGQKFVGRGENTQSYVPLVAQHFLVGRGFRNECPNSPERYDPAQAAGVDFDCLSFAQMKWMIEWAVRTGGWLILAGHEIGNPANYQTVDTDTLTEICRYANDPANRIWIDTVAIVGGYINKQRQ